MATIEKAQQQLNVRTVVHGPITWVDVTSPSLAEMEYLRKLYDFHPLALDDCLSKVQLPKVDDYDEYLFLVLHFPLFDNEARLTVPIQVSIFVSGDYMVTIHRGDLRPLTKLFSDCQASEAVRETVMGHSSGYLLYRILDGLVDYCFPILSKLIEGVDDVEARVLDMSAKGMARELSVIKRDILAYRRIVRPQILALELLERKEYPFLKVDPDVYFGDLADHMRHISVELEDLKEVTESLDATHLSLTTHRTNETMRVLTIIATMLLPMTVVSSLFGMNVDLPLGGTRYAFALVLGAMASIAIVMLAFFRHRRWF